MLNKVNTSPVRQKLIVYVVLAVVILAVYWQVTQYDFVNLDDPVYVTKNAHVMSGLTLDGFAWAFSTFHAEFWHPLTWLSLMLDYQIYGLNASGYHLTNIILHILSSLLLFWLFNRMTGAIWRSIFVAALFALHPLHVESVAWITERKDALSAFFWMLTLCLYVYYTEKPIIRRYLLVLLCFTCSLMSKSIVVTLPVILILLDYWPLGRLQKQIPAKPALQTKTQGADQSDKKRKGIKGKPEKSIVMSSISKNSVQKTVLFVPLWQIREKAPFFFLSIVFIGLTLYAQDALKVETWPFWSRMANAFVSYATYLIHIFCPLKLAVFYPFVLHLPVWKVVSSIALFFLISASIIFTAKRFPQLFVGWFWYVVMLAPVIGFIQVGAHAWADRYSYLSSIGITIILAWGAPLLFKSEVMRKRILFPAGIVVLVILTGLTWKQCGYWKNDITLFNHALQVTKDNYHAHFLRGFAYNNLDQYQRAIEDFNEAIRLKPYFADAYSNRGVAYENLGQHQRAIEDFNEAIRLNPYYANAYYNRGMVYIKFRQYQRAIEEFNQVINLRPDDADAYGNRGIAYGMLGNNNLGCRDVQKACELGNCKLLEAANTRGLCR